MKYIPQERLMEYIPQERLMEYIPLALWVACIPLARWKACWMECIPREQLIKCIQRALHFLLSCHDVLLWNFHLILLPPSHALSITHFCRHLCLLFSVLSHTCLAYVHALE